MKIASVQINTKIGDFESNREKNSGLYKKKLFQQVLIWLYSRNFQSADILLLIFWTRAHFMKKNIESLRWLQKNIPDGIAAVIGHVGENRSFSGKPYYNCATVIKDRKIIHTQEKLFFRHMMF